MNNNHLTIVKSYLLFMNAPAEYLIHFPGLFPVTHRHCIEGHGVSWTAGLTIGWSSREVYVPSSGYIDMENLPVVPHKAVAEVSKIGNL